MYFKKSIRLLKLQTYLEVNGDETHYIPTDIFTDKEIDLKSKIIKSSKKDRLLGYQIASGFVPTEKYIELQMSKIKETFDLLLKDKEYYEERINYSLNVYNNEMGISVITKELLDELLLKEDFTYIFFKRDFEKINRHIDNIGNITIEDFIKDLSHISYLLPEDLSILHKNKKFLEIKFILQDPYYYDKKRNSIGVKFFYDISNMSFKKVQEFLENKENLFKVELNNGEYIEFIPT